LAKSIGFLPMQLSYDMLGAKHMRHYAFPSTLLIQMDFVTENLMFSNDDEKKIIVNNLMRDFQ
jgi:hypothetical protein